jgi:hypothetical protein
MNINITVKKISNIIITLYRVFNFKGNRKYFERMTLNSIQVFLQGTGHINTYVFDKL